VIDIRALIDQHMNATKLDILVFGPAVDPPSSDPFIASMQTKRQEIRKRLQNAGHNCLFGEDVVDPALPAHLADPLLQETVAMKAADLIIVLVGAPGSIAEAKTITTHKDLCAKAAFYCFEDHKDGLVAKHLQFMTNYGATFTLVRLPDVVACQLTGTVLDRVLAVQAGKAFLF